jgi:hypothetical protein
MKTLIAIVVSFSFTLLQCRAGDTNSVIGDWQSDEVLSQLGPSVTAYSFRTSGTFTLSTKFTQGLIPPISGTGTYHLVITNSMSLTNQLVTVMNGRTNFDSCYFQNDRLIIDEGRPSKVFKLKRTK